MHDKRMNVILHKFYDDFVGRGDPDTPQTRIVPLVTVRRGRRTLHCLCIFCTFMRLTYLVVEQALTMISNDDIMRKIADMVLALQKQENTTLPLLRKQLAKTAINP